MKAFNPILSKYCCVVAAVLITSLIYAQNDTTNQKIAVNLATTFSKFQQQVKSGVGTISGDRLVDEYQFGYLISSVYKPVKFFGFGFYFRHDIGKREAALFNGFDENGATVTIRQLGGNYNEIWLGPLASFYWKKLILDIGFGAYGSRFDAGRYDLPSKSGSINGNFTTHPTIAWLMAIGGNITISKTFDLSFKAEYRVRYYTQRNGEDILTGVEHGTQSLAPMIGILWKL